MCDSHAAQCRCHRAVMNGYNGMKRSGAAECEAVRAALQIYKFHHPEKQTDQSRLQVESWLYSSRAH